MTNPIVIAIIVSYYPDENELGSLLVKIESQVAHVIVVDNTQKEDNKSFLIIKKYARSLENFSCIRLGSNLGVAAALNVGILEAIKMNSDFLLLSDQDSLPDGDMVAGLLRAFADLSSKMHNVAAVGALYTDVYSKKTLPFKVEKRTNFFPSRRYPTYKEPHIEAFSLITSGTLISCKAIKKIGLMNEKFFIDKVDIEWCCRARSVGYSVFGTGWARLEQRMGVGEILKVWVLGWRTYNSYTPTRVYYQVRNTFALCRLKYVDVIWKIYDCLNSLGIIYEHVGFHSNRIEYIQKTFCGIWDGLRGRMGAR